MAVATSPYTQNDYQAASNYRPYELPINDIYKSITAQNAFWEQGAARIKNVYESALNLDLTLDSNIQMKNDFMEKAQKQLTKLSEMDVSDPSVQRQGFGIFKPLLRDKGIVYDDFLTKKYRSVISDADKWKNDEKTKGEGFHMDNLAYALRGFKGFSASTSRDALDGIYKNAKDAEYTPYYDVSKERMTILDKCKPDVTSNTTTQGMYLETSKTSSLSSQKLWGCLEAGISDKARQQIRISGAVRYGDNYKDLRDDYIATAKEKREYYNQQIKDLSVQKAAFAGKAGYEQYSKGVQDQMDQYSAGMAKLDKDIGTYGSWDDDYMKKNYEDLASMAYFRRANGAFADAFARKDIEQSKKADPIGMMFYTQKKLDDRQAANFTHNENMENYKMRLKLMAGEGNMDDATRLRLEKQFGVPDQTLTSMYGTATEEPGTSASVLRASVDESNKNIQSKAKELVEFAQKSPELSKVVGEIGDMADFAKTVPKLEEYIRLRLKADPNDVDALEMNAGLNSYIQLNNEKIHKQSILEDAQSETDKLVEKNFGKEQKNIQNQYNQILSGPQIPITLNKGNFYNSPKLTLTPNQLVDDLRNGKAKLIPNIGGWLVDYAQPGDLYSVSKESKRWALQLPQRNQPGFKETQAIVHNIIEYYQNSSSANQKVAKFRGDAINTYLGERTAVQKMKFAAGNLLGTGKIDKDMTTPMKFISSMFGSSLGEAQFNTIGGFDPVTGWTDIQAVDNKGKSIPSSKLVDAAANSEFGASAYDESKYPNAIRVKIPYLEGILKAPQYSESINDLINYASKKVMAENIPQGLVLDAGIAPTGEKIQLKTTKSLASGAAKHTILVNGTEIPIRIGNDAATAMSYISKLLSGEPIK